jgi:hypothetical protein
LISQSRGLGDVYKRQGLGTRGHFETKLNVTRITL